MTSWIPTAEEIAEARELLRGVAVPVVASVNAVATHLAGQGRAVETSEVTTDEEEQVPDEPGGAS